MVWSGRRPKAAYSEGLDLPDSRTEAIAAWRLATCKSVPATAAAYVASSCRCRLHRSGRGEAFTCTPTGVRDGDGPLWCAEGPRIRLSSIPTPEFDGDFRPGQPCPDASGEETRDALVRLVGEPVGWSAQGQALVRGPALRCVSAGDGGHDRTDLVRVTERRRCELRDGGGGFALRWEQFWQVHWCERK